MEFTRAEMTRRLETARALMDEAGVDCLLITDRENFCYFSGVHASLYQTRRPWCAIIPLRTEPVAVMREGWVTLTLKRNGFFQNVVGYEFPVSREVPPKIADAIKACGATRVGCEFGLEMRIGLPLDDFAAVRRLVPGIEFVDGSSIIWRLRMTKSTEEVARMRKACEITTAARQQVFAQVRPGMTEHEVAELWADLMHKAGAERPSFIYINTGTVPDLLPSRDKVLQCGETLWLDGGAYVGGYTCDFSRVASLGPATARQRQLNRDAVEVMDALLEHVRPGVPVADLAVLAAREKTRRGFAAQHGRAPGGAGHSMGMLINEPPMIAPWDETILTPGLVIGLELGPVDTEGMFITEELLQVTEIGYDRLTAEAPTLVELDF